MASTLRLCCLQFCERELPLFTSFLDRRFSAFCTKKKRNENRMSFAKPKTAIEVNDTVILYLTVQNFHAIDVIPYIKNKRDELIENVFQTSYGALKVKDLIGVKYGTKVTLTKGWAYVLQPTPDLWTQSLPHRTQIIYTPDISMIVFQLEIKPGSIVIESGTGSGSLSHSILRAIKPLGHLHTFDFHEQRCDIAREEFASHGIGDFVTVYHRDVCANGFSDELNGKADAIFLDLPAPHLAVPHSLKALKHSGGRFCSFSPCIEQVQRCCEALQQNGFTEIQTMEILQIEEYVKTKMINVLDLEFVKTKKSTDDTDNKDAKTPKEQKKYLTTQTPITMPGHTGYLTFATLPPVFAR